MKRLLILSGKGGTGKTTTAAAFIRFAGAKAVADCDVDAPNLHLVAERRGKPEVTPFLGGLPRSLIFSAEIRLSWTQKNALAAASARPIAALTPSPGRTAFMPSVNTPARAAGSAPMYVPVRPSAWLPTQPDERSFTRTAAYFPLPF